MSLSYSNLREKLEVMNAIARHCLRLEHLALCEYMSDVIWEELSVALRGDLDRRLVSLNLNGNRDFDTGRFAALSKLLALDGNLSAL